MSEFSPRSTADADTAGVSGLRPLRQAREGAILSGVCRGLANTLEVDVTIVRLAFVALAFVNAAAIVAYLAMMFIVPFETPVEEGSDVQRLVEHARQATVALFMATLACDRALLRRCWGEQVRKFQDFGRR